MRNCDFWMDGNDRSRRLKIVRFLQIKQEVLQEHLGRHYHFELADDICSQTIDL